MFNITQHTINFGNWVSETYVLSNYNIAIYKTEGYQSYRSSEKSLKLVFVLCVMSVARHSMFPSMQA